MKKSSVVFKMSGNASNPLPPPPPIPNQTSDLKEQVKNRLIPDLKECSKCIWALEYKELKYACIRFNVCCDNLPYRIKYKHFKSLLQEGPTCGLVAISMLLNHKISPETLLVLAKEKGYSNNGELFSVDWAFSLLQISMEVLKFANVELKIVEMNLYSKDVITWLMSGCVLIVPYDSDRNHSPCLKKGHKAHWALITGILITDHDQQSDDFDPSNVYVTAKHGKSLHVALWKLKDLSNSNNNLLEFSPEREDDHLQYVLPNGGLESREGLKGRFILVYDSQQDLL